MKTRTYWLSLVLGPLVSGCLESSPVQEPSPAEPTPTEPNPNEPNPNEPNEPNEPGTDVGTPVDHLAAVQPLPWCLPQPRAITPPVTLPQIPEEALERCGLQAEGHTYPQRVHSTETTFTHDETGLWVNFPRGSDKDLMHLVLGGADGRHVLELRYGRGVSEATFAFASTVPVEHYRFDLDGNIVERATLRGAARELELSQRFEAGRLVERVERLSGPNGSVLLTTTWTWEGDRLLSSRSEGYDRTWTVDFTYDAQGRPIEVTRRRGDRVVTHMSWQFDANNHLTGRTVDVDTVILPEDRHTYADGFDVNALDNFGIDGDMPWDSDPWTRSVPQVSEAGCLNLPTTTTHGYPAAEREFDLLAETADRPHGIGWAYGNNSYGWGYGDRAWYGHGGIHSPLPPTFYGQQIRLSNTLSYKQSRMLSEEFEFVIPKDLDQPALDQAPAKASRTRITGGGAPDPIVIDRLDLRLPVETGAADHTRELRYNRDLNGHIVSRDLVDSVNGPMERQTWTRDDQGRWLSHEITTPQYGSMDWPAWTQPCESCGTDPLKVWRRYERDVDTHGRTVRLAATMLNIDPHLATETHYTYDSAGRLLSEAITGGSAHHWQYDAEGRLTHEARYYSGNTDADAWIDIEYDAEGRWVRRVTHHFGYDEPSQVTWRDYATCEPE